MPWGRKRGRWEGGGAFHGHGLPAVFLLKRLLDRMAEVYPGRKIRLYPIRNDFFGEMITVAGLITGQDLVAQLKGKPLGSRLLLPSVMFKTERRYSWTI